MNDFSRVPYEEAMDRARECVPLLRERAQKCEDARVLLPENEKLLHEAGLFRYHQPKRFGGMELPFVAVVDIVAELARGCPSTAWNAATSLHHWSSPTTSPNPARDLGRQSGRPDRLIDRAGGGTGKKGRRRFCRERQVAVLLGRGQLRLEHACSHHL